MSRGEIERRAYAAEMRVAGEPGKAPMIAGHAAVFDQCSEDLGGFVERIAPGAFTKTITLADVRALFNHDPNFVLGRNKAGTLRLSEDSKGLAVEIDPPETQSARDLMVSLRRGDINQMSFGFVTKADQWAKVNGAWVRTLLEVDLFDVSPVTFPAYPQTAAAVRSLAAAQAAAELPAFNNRIPILRRRLDLAEI